MSQIRGGGGAGFSSGAVGERSTTNRRESKDGTSYKVVMVGDSGVGKSCILEQLRDDSLSSSSSSSTTINAFISTIGVDVKNRTLKMQESGRTIRLQVWDTGGQQRFRPVLSTCYRNAVGIVVVFDVTNRKSFANLNQWMSEVEEFSGGGVANKQMASSAGPKLMLMGNKCDLQDRRQVDYDTANQFAKENNMTYLETSAIKEGTASTIRDGFASLIRPRLDSCPSSFSRSSP